jgi:16S rRNA C967 or C1407 C5-methylase (RsmB/RsmF family)
MSLQLPLAFTKQIKSVLPEEVGAELLLALQENPKVSIRINRSKGIHEDSFNEGILGDAIPHCGDGFVLNSRPLFTADPAFHAGSYYVQEANSMIIGELIKRLIQNFDPGALILDLCASPGGKSTHIASHLRPGDLLVANEVISGRTGTLIENLCKWGQGNHVVTSADAKVWGGIRGLFQIVVADMPCSGEGMFRKTPDAVHEWSEENVALCTLRQQRIAHDIWPSLAEGGIMIYSTCTYNRSENEDNINHIVEELGAEIMEFDFPSTLGIFELEPGKYRMMPNLTLGEGFFFSILRKTTKERLSLPKVAKMKPSKNLPNFLHKTFMGYDLPDGLMAVKTGEWEQYYPNLPALLPSVKQTGINAGQLNKNQWKAHPEYDLLAQKSIPYPTLDVSTDDALSYYKRAFLSHKSDLKGVVGLRWKGLSLGTVNAVNNGLNNLWPMSWRILRAQIQASTLLR